MEEVETDIAAMFKRLLDSIGSNKQWRNMDLVQENWLIYIGNMVVADMVGKGLVPVLYHLSSWSSSFSLDVDGGISET